MGLAIEQARLAEAHGDVPIGAAILRDGEPLAAAGNERELRRDPTAHAEILAIRAAAEALGGWRLPGTTLYVTLEPCAMCAGAIVLARIPTVVFAAPDPKGGAAGSVLDVFAEPALNHRPEVIARRPRRGVRGVAAGLLRARRGPGPAMEPVGVSLTFRGRSARPRTAAAKLQRNPARPLNATEREGFEPSRRVNPAHAISNRAP